MTADAPGTAGAEGTVSETDRAEPVLDVRGLTVRADRRDMPGALVDAVSVRVDRGRCLGVVGESGSGKSLTLRALIDLLPSGVRRTAGELALSDGTAPPVAYDPAGVRGRRIAMIFQDPVRSLDPRQRAAAPIIEALRRHTGLTRSAAATRALDLLHDVGIDDPQRVARSYPHQLSGGQRQRISIAAALACAPQLLLCDEPTTALDVTTQAQILALLRGLSATRGMALILVSHDLAVVSRIADDVAVMYAGQIVEHGPTRTVLHRPRHPYTAALLRAVPRPHAGRQRLAVIPGLLPPAGTPRAGCGFAPRCPLAESDCAQPIEIEPVGPAHTVRCRRAHDHAPSHGGER